MIYLGVAVVLAGLVLPVHGAGPLEESGMIQPRDAGGSSLPTEERMVRVRDSADEDIDQENLEGLDEATAMGSNATDSRYPSVESSGLSIEDLARRCSEGLGGWWVSAFQIIRNGTSNLR